jgi:hypothetical protein
MNGQKATKIRNAGEKRQIIAPDLAIYLRGPFIYLKWKIKNGGEEGGEQNLPISIFKLILIG